ncbi:MAG: EpsG family protein [Lachnospiraceae bacterium]|nr:EpsG family protein [Lachnospiraceae bacterium]
MDALKQVEPTALVYVILTALVLLLSARIDNRELLPLSPGLQSRQQRYNRIAIIGIYLLLTGVSACRIAVGNDYWGYRKSFDIIAQDRYVSFESGFNFIVKAVYAVFGYSNYLPVFALFSIVTVLFFVLALRTQGRFFAFSLFLLMTGGFYFNSLNSIRYYLALAVALYAIRYIFSADYLHFAVLIFLGMFFHKSVLLVVPVYLVTWILANLKYRKWMLPVGGILGAGFLGSLLFGQELYRKLIFRFYPYYEGSVFDNGDISYVNILRCAAVLVLCGICFQQFFGKNARLRFYGLLSLWGLIVYLCGSFIPTTSRIGYYMIIPQIFLIPELVEGCEKEGLRRLLRVGVVAGFLLYFAFFIVQMYDEGVKLLPYRNWIFQ